MFKQTHAKYHSGYIYIYRVLVDPANIPSKSLTMFGYPLSKSWKILIAPCPKINHDWDARPVAIQAKLVCLEWMGISSGRAAITRGKYVYRSIELYRLHMISEHCTYMYIYIYYIYILCTYIIYIYESVYDCHNSMARTENCSGFMDLLHDKSVRCKPLSFPRYGVQTRPSGGIVMSTQRESQSTGSQAVGFPGKRFPCRGMVGPGSLSELVDKVMFEFTPCNTICSTIRILCWHCGTGLMICQKEIS